MIWSYREQLVDRLDRMPHAAHFFHTLLGSAPEDGMLVLGRDEYPPKIGGLILAAGLGEGTPAATSAVIEFLEWRATDYLDDFQIACCPCLLPERYGAKAGTTTKLDRLNALRAALSYPPAVSLTCLDLSGAVPEPPILLYDGKQGEAAAQKSGLAYASVADAPLVTEDSDPGTLIQSAPLRLLLVRRRGPWDGIPDQELITALYRTLDSIRATSSSR